MWPLVRGLDLAWQLPDTEPRRRPIVTFDEPGFPAVDAIALPAVPGARSATSVAELVDALQPDAVLAWRHGSTFPADAWKAIFSFLENGGSLLYVGGEPWTRPVTGASGSRRVEPRTVAQLQALRLNQSYRVRFGAATLQRVAGANPGSRPLPSETWIAALEPRFTDTQDFPTEAGSPGARDALLRPLAYAHASGGDPRFPAAAVAYAIDRLRGPFAGGRWVFWLASAPPQNDEWEWLLDEASRPPVDFRVGPTFGCFHEGEQPSLIVRAHRPGVTGSLRTPCQLVIDGPGASRRTQTVDLHVAEHGTMHVPLSGSFAPGLYRVVVDGGHLGRTTTGFWMFDHDLFTSGDTLTFDDYTLRRNGRPEPVVGTTTMSATVHRDFLFEPNAAVWDDTFAELASLRMNMVRTGLWSGWRRISVDANVVDESFVRALEAYYLTARKHGLPIVFSLFAFVPEDFGTGDPYFDPRALEGQRALLSALARRMASAREFIWDLINEPSFASPRNLWTLRPTGSAYERRAFAAWLAARYQPAGGGAESGWQEVVRRRWRIRPDEAIDLPSEEDFADAYLMGARRPYRALDYALFAQDAFERWIGEMTAAIRAGGSQAAITVGQDENGLRTSPGPLFHHRSVDFTSMHTWWNNDALLWDGVLAKAGGTPLLVSETGIMQRERLSGEAVRSPDEFAALLSKKIGYAFAAHGFGVIQWCYETNPFMNSDNEVAIGLKRVDGSAKPEHRVLAAAAAFIARNRSRFDGYVAPDVALVVPSADQLSPRSLSAAATRATVRAFYEELQIPLYAVVEHRAARDLGQPQVIMLPACRSISEEGWQAIAAAVAKGATLICSGWFESDDAGLPAERLGVPSRLLHMVEEMPAWEGAPATAFRFGGTLPESWGAAALAAPRRIRHGAGTIVHHPLPIEWAEPTASVAHFYRAAMARTRVAPRIELAGGAKPGVLVATIPFRDAWLLVAVNETARSHAVVARRPGAAARVSFDVAADHARMAVIDPHGWKILDVS
ncbi:MAG TPA: hypothetical protein VJ813_13920 [Vicinamibacterales bacterium]|nr:hypothetical protein [Vicinamibacterales bacterium]